MRTGGFPQRRFSQLRFAQRFFSQFMGFWLGLSKSRWVTDIIRKYTAHEWPQDCLALAGRFTDFPFCNDSSAMLPDDAPRISF